MRCRSLFAVLVLLSVAPPVVSAGRLTAKLVNHLPAGTKPTGAALLDGGTLLAVSDRIDRAVVIYDAVTMAQTRTYGNVAFGPWGIQSCPGDKSFLVADWSGDSLALVNRASGQHTLVKVGLKPSYVALAPDGLRAYSAGNLSGDVTISDLLTGKAVRTLTIGDKPMGIAASPDGRWLYVASCKSNKVSRIDLKHEVVLDHFGAPLAATTNLVITPDGSRLLAAGTDDRLLIMDAETGATTKVKVGYSPAAVAVTPDGMTAFVANYDGASIEVVDLESGVAYDSLAVGKGPIHVVTNGRRLWSVNEQAGSISVFDLSGATAMDLPAARPAVVIPALRTGVLTSPPERTGVLTSPPERTGVLTSPPERTGVLTSPATTAVLPVPVVMPIALELPAPPATEAVVPTPAVGTQAEADAPRRPAHSFRKTW